MEYIKYCREVNNALKFLCTQNELKRLLYRQKMAQSLSTLPYPVQFKGMSDDHGKLEMAYTNILPDGTPQQQHIVRDLSFTTE